MSGEAKSAVRGSSHRVDEGLSASLQIAYERGYIDALEAVLGAAITHASATLYPAEPVPPETAFVRGLYERVLLNGVLPRDAG